MTNRIDKASERAKKLRKIASASLEAIDDAERDIRRLERENIKLQEQIKRFEHFDSQLTDLAESCGALAYGGGATGGNAIKAIAARLRGLLDLERQVNSNEPSPEALAELEQIKRDNEQKRIKANTLDVWDALVFNISNWSTDFQVAPDCESAIQSAIFPLVYEQVADGKEGYLLTGVPQQADEVLRRGRELIRSIRQKCDTAVTHSQSTWDEHARVIQDWVITDALPAMYEAASEDWNTDRCFTFEQMTAWRDKPANRPVAFGKVFDITDLQGQHHERTEDLAEFNRRALQSKIDPEIAEEMAGV